MSNVEEKAPPPRPAPVLTEDNEGYWLAAREGRLAIQRCRECGRFNHPPRPMCPICHSLDQEWQEVSVEGEVYSYALLHHPQHPAFEYPVLAVLVELDEGVRIVSNLAGVEVAAVRNDMAVEVFFERFGDVTLPQFRPAV